VDGIAFSGLLPGGVAASLVWAAAMTLSPRIGSAALGAPLVLALAGTVAVYNVDRLRDVENDRPTSPDRSRFVDRHRTALIAMTGLAALAGVVAALQMPLMIWGLCGVAAMLGLLHRRLKESPAFKIAYVTGAWLGVTIGLPVLALAEAGRSLPHIAWLVGILGGAIAANLIASDYRGEAGDGARRGLRAARALAAASLGLGGAAAIAGSSTAALVFVPAAELVSLAFFRSDERYGLLVVDGALMMGALLGGGALWARWL